MIAHVKVNLFQGPSVNAAYVARIDAGLGEKDKAIEWFEKAYVEDRFIESSFASIKVDPTLDPLRSDPRFRELLRRMNIQP